jgi:hypothetical protein
LPANVHQVFAPSRRQPPATRVARNARLATSEPKSGSVIAIRAERVAGRDARQPVLALRLGAAGQQRARQDLGPRDQAARRREDASDSASVTTSIIGVSSWSSGRLPP